MVRELRYSGQEFPRAWSQLEVDLQKTLEELEPQVEVALFHPSGSAPAPEHAPGKLGLIPVRFALG